MRRVIVRFLHVWHFQINGVTGLVPADCHETPVCGGHAATAHFLRAFPHQSSEVAAFLAVLAFVGVLGLYIVHFVVPGLDDCFRALRGRKLGQILARRPCRWCDVLTR